MTEESKKVVKEEEKKKTTAVKKVSDDPVRTASKTGNASHVHALSKANSLSNKLVSEGFRKKAEDSNPSFNMQRLKQTIELAVEKDPKLLECSPKSIQLALLDCVLSGVYPDGQQATLIAYGKEVKLEIMIQGIIKSALRSNIAKKIVTRSVYESDDLFVSIDDSGKQFFDHKINIKKERGELIAAYAVITLQNDEVITELLRSEDIAECRAAAKTDMVWKRWTGEMARKSALRRAFKYLPDGDIIFENLKTIELKNEIGE